MAGYSGTPLSQKLGIKPGALVLIVAPPTELDGWLAPLPKNVKCTVMKSTAKGTAKSEPASIDVILCFVRSTKEYLGQLDALKVALRPNGGLWIAWPKRAAAKLDPGWATNLTEDIIRTLGLAAGLVDNKVCAISDVWSGLRFVYRIKDRG